MSKAKIIEHIQEAISLIRKQSTLTFEKAIYLATNGDPVRNTKEQKEHENWLLKVYGVDWFRRHESFHEIKPKNSKNKKENLSFVPKSKNLKKGKQ